MDEDRPARPIGQLYAYEGGRGLRALAPDVRIANSIAFSPDGRRMYFADTPTKIIRAYDYDVDSSALSGERVFAALRGPGSPDGSTVDSDGCLWNAEWGGGRVVRYTPHGLIDRIVELPCAQVKLDRLFVTTARTALDSATLAREPLAGALFAVEAGVRGLADTAFPVARLPLRD